MLRSLKLRPEPFPQRLAAIPQGVSVRESRRKKETLDGKPTACFDPVEPMRVTRLCRRAEGRTDPEERGPPMRVAIVLCGFFLCLLGSCPGLRAAEAGSAFSLEGPVLSLRSALARGLQQNLDLQVEELTIPIRQQDATVEDSVFDPVLEASIFSRQDRAPSASAFTEDNVNEFRGTGGSAGVRKRFRFGLESTLGFDSNRSTNNSTVDSLRPQYRSILLVDFTQPLLKDFGSPVNTTSYRVNQNRIRQAIQGYELQAQRLVAEIETAYYLLAGGIEVLRYRTDSRQLAKDLLQGNRQKLEAGIVPVSEVQEAETALASRDEQIVFARQQVETVEIRLRDLLALRPGEPFFDEFFVTEPLGRPENGLPALEAALTQALAKRPDLERQRIEVRNQDIQIRYYKNQRLPRVDLEASLGVNGLSGGDRPVTFAGVTASSPYKGDYLDSVRGAAEGDGYEWFAGLRFSYPIGNRAAQASYVRTDLEKRQALYGLKRLEEAAEAEVRGALIDCRRSLERIEIAQRFEGLAEKTLAQEMIRLQGGLSDTFRVLAFQEDLVEARVRKVRAVVDLNQGLANLHMATGTNLERFEMMTEKRYEGWLDEM